MPKSVVAIIVTIGLSFGLYMAYSRRASYDAPPWVAGLGVVTLIIIFVGMVIYSKRNSKGKSGDSPR